MATIDRESPKALPQTGPEPPARPGRVLALWVIVLVVLNGTAWLTGVREYALGVAVEEGTSEVERRGIGEVGDEVIRKAIRTQQATLPFWSTLAVLGDFLVEPLVLVTRAVAVATLFSVFAALTGRSIGFGSAMMACAWAQGYWVLGLAVRVALMIALRRPEAETSLALFLAPGPCPAALLLVSRQCDVFALLGWLEIARGGWRRGQVNLAAAVAICGALWLSESIVRIVCSLVLGAGMRLTVLPQ